MLFLQIFGFFRTIWYDHLISVSLSISMVKSLSSYLTRLFATLIVLSGFLFVSSASSSPDDLTGTWYMLQVANLNPVNPSASTVWGKEAIEYMLKKISSLLLFMIPIIAAVSFIIAGYYYILSSGDSEKANQAKTIIKWNIIAILVALFSYVIIKLIAWILGGSI